MNKVNESNKSNYRSIHNMSHRWFTTDRRSRWTRSECASNPNFIIYYRIVPAMPSLNLFITTFLLAFRVSLHPLAEFILAFFCPSCIFCSGVFRKFLLVIRVFNFGSSWMVSSLIRIFYRSLFMNCSLLADYSYY